MKFGKWVVKCRIPILILAVALLVPSLIGMIMTRINYDMLTYLPGDIDTVVGPVSYTHLTLPTNSRV